MKYPSCEDRLKRASSKLILVRPGGLSSGSGLMNQLRWVGVQTLLACSRNASLIQAGVIPDAFKARTTPLPVSAIFDEESFNAHLLTIPQCKHTQLLPRSCVHDLSGLSRKLHLKIECIEETGFRDYANLTNIIVPRLLGGEGRWQPDHPRVDISKKYAVVHLNIDCDWMLYTVWLREKALLSQNMSSLAEVSRRRKIFQSWRSGEGQVRDDISVRFCSGGDSADSLTTRLATRILSLFHTSVREHVRTKQIVVATSIGKQGKHTKWLLDDFVSKLPEYNISTGRARSTHYLRELSAVAELEIASKAVEGVGLDRSTFWDFASNQIELNGGNTSTIKVCDERGLKENASSCFL